MNINMHSRNTREIAFTCAEDDGGFLQRVTCELNPEDEKINPRGRGGDVHRS